MAKNTEGNAEKFFKEFGKRVDQFVVELNEANERLQKDFEGKFDDLKKSGENLKKEIKNKERWAEVEKSLKKAASELENAFKAAFKKPQKTKAKKTKAKKSSPK